MGKYISIVGIILVMIGTIFSLWSILGTKSKYYGSVELFENQHTNFKQDKRRVIIGTAWIITGSILQIVGLFI